jgi:aspartyl-tRNA(Asn)/glutamyl-tRNA(Gln) amidotransferase subunit C
MSVDAATVRRIATLARIAITDEEVPPLVGELNQILDWVEQLGEVDTDGVMPMTSVTDITAPLRTDEVTDGNKEAEVLRNAPDAREGHFTVPKVVE